MSDAAWDVGIIGAGVAGLTAAWRLEQAGRRVVLFEARDRSGGRAYSPEVGGHRIDLGATWVWDSERAVQGLIADLGLETFPHPTEGLDTWDAEEVLRLTFPRSAVPERRLRGGVQALTDALVSRVAPIRFGCPVRRLVPTEAGLVVATDRGEQTARHVLAALPPSLVAPLVADAAPELAALWRRVPVWMGDTAKVVAVFPDEFWRAHGWSGRGASRRGPMVEVHPLSGPDGTPACLFGFVPQAAGTEDLEARVRAQLLRMFGPEAVPHAVRIQAWWQEPFTTDGGPTDPRLFGHPWLRQPALGGRLQLISCETSGVSPGHLDGAVERATAACAGL